MAAGALFCVVPIARRPNRATHPFVQFVTKAVVAVASRCSDAMGVLLAGPSEKTIKRLFAFSGNVCAHPGCIVPIVESNGAVTGEICHIRAQSPLGPRYDATQSDMVRHRFENLILLCQRYHTIIDADKKTYTVEALEEIKAIREAANTRPEHPADAIYAKVLLEQAREIKIGNNGGTILIGSPGAIVAKAVAVKAPGRTVKIQPPMGTIGVDAAASRYIKHLISRYNEFASKEVTRQTQFNFGAISKNIETRFRGQWALLPIGDFEGVCTYLQTRISRTRMAKRNAAKGYPAFSSFSDFEKERE